MTPFSLRTGSKLKDSSAVQAQALAAIRATKHPGIVVMPCGSGKTSVFVQAAVEAGRKALFLCYEKQGVIQVADTIREHTTVQESQLCVYTSDIKKEPNALYCFMVTTYGMFASTSGSRSELTKRVRSYVMSTAWDLVVLDEVHHAAAATYKPLVEQLVLNSRRTLGFTGTLCRNELMGQNNGLTRDEFMEQQFGFIGEVLYSRKCVELEDDGLIAKVRCMQVLTPLTEHFANAHAEAKGSCKQYVQSLHPNKLVAVWLLVRMHRALGEIGMVFVNHLLHAKVVQQMLGPRWEILSGGNAHGTEGVHTAEANAAIVQRFNDGLLEGVVSTPVGESALDVFNPRFRYAIVVDAHGGPTAASQKLGRLARTPRAPQRADEPDEAYRHRLWATQKEAAYYEVVTPDTEEETAARGRQEQFEHEGYEFTTRSYDEVADCAAAAGWRAADAPHSDDVAQVRLLAEALSYQHMGTLEGAANAQAKATLAPHRTAIRTAKAKAASASHSIFKQRHQQAARALAKQTAAHKASARDAKHRTLRDSPLPPEAAGVLRGLELPPELLARAGIALPPAQEIAHEGGDKK